MLGATALTGGCIGEVYRVDLAGAAPLVAKLGKAENSPHNDPEISPGTGRNGGLALEGWMLAELARLSDLPVPAVIHASDTLLLMEYLEAGGSLDAQAQEEAAAMLAALHDITAPAFGLGRATLIGGLHQPNDETASWRDFFAQQRLIHMAGEAHEAGRLAAETRARVETLAGRLERWIDEPAAPALIHGDMWGGNILCRRTERGNRISGFVDPAIYFADAEIELAFATLFNTMGDAFFGRYNELRPLRPGFFEIRRDLYNLYPLLVHVRLFGGGHVASVERILSRLGV